MDIQVRPSPAASQPPATPTARVAPIMTSGLGSAGATATPLWLPMPFLLAGALGAAVFGALLPFVVPQAMVAPGLPHVLALTHIATLGWLTMTIMGASLQLTPVVLVSPLRATRFVRLHFPTYLAGVLLLIGGFWTGITPVLIAGGSLVALAVAHHVIMLAVTIAHATTRPLSTRYLAASIAYLCGVVALGLTAALNFQFGFLGDNADRLLLAHITLGVVGWLTCTLIGVSYTLAPMFALVHGHKDSLGRRVFALLNTGILGLAAGFAFGWVWLQAIAGLALIAAVWTFAYDYWRMFQSRKRKMLDTTQRHAIVAVGYLAAVIPVGVGLALTGARPSSGMLLALAIAALVGWLGQSVVGYLYKIVPFLVWQSRYAPLVGRQPVPLMRDLVNQRIATGAFWLMTISLPLAVVCAWANWLAPLQVACVALGLALIASAANIYGVLIPRSKPRTSP